MNAAQLLAHFDRISEAPDAIPRLRRFILDLAVRGKLVEQDPNDEPAGELLSLLESNSREIPSNWIAANVGKLLDFQYGKGLPASERLDKGRVCVFGSNGIVGYCTEALTEEAAVIIGRKGSAGALNLCMGPSWTTDVAYFVNPPAFFDIRFLFIALQTLDLGNLGKGVKPGLSRNDAYELDLVVPPLPEQHRIVAKVDELMALCDQLEAAKTERESQRDRLIAASLHHLNSSADTDASREHARFYLNHLPRLTTRPEHIKQLRQTILNLAVRGRLVPQDPNDEPAMELLKKIRAEKERLVKGKENIAIELKVSNTPFPIPQNWIWVYFGQIMISRDGERIPVSKEERNNRKKIYDYYGASGIIDKIDDYLFDKPLLLIGEDGANLINRSTPIAFIARGQYWVNNHAHVLDGISEEFLRFIEMYINATDLRPYVTGTAQPKMNQAKMNSIPIALPPENEQHRIVAKVDELMDLCDQLEGQLTTTQADSRRLLETMLHRALGERHIIV